MSAKKYIPGIYNYCDRWCERCHFTSRCRIYQPPDDMPTEERDITNEVFWKKISASFATAHKFIADYAEKQGLNLEEILNSPESENILAKKEAISHATKNHPLAKLCEQYYKKALPFIKSGEMLVNTVREDVKKLHMGITEPEDVVHKMAALGECFEVIQWYLFFIHVKLQRALHGALENEFAEDNDYRKDSEGSAKIALVAVERSMGAWQTIYNLLPEAEDAALTALSHLQQIEIKTKEVFPNAMAFKRPGFDE